MNFTVHKEDRLSTFQLHDSRLDSTNAADVKAELLIISQEEIDVLIIDLSEVTFCDSSGLSAILLAERQLRERKGGIMVVDRHGKIRAILEIAKLTEMIPVFKTFAEARKAIEED